jgi:putative PIN family toxin of toxin-antitoxin system
MIRAVLDTNVVVSALLRPEGRPALILKLALSKQFRRCVSESLLEEYTEVLARAQFGWDQRRRDRLIRDLRAASTLVIPRKRLRITSDPDDNKVMECALEARADFVVTGNVRDFLARYQDVRVINPLDFLVLLASTQSGG